MENEEIQYCDECVECIDPETDEPNCKAYPASDSVHRKSTSYKFCSTVRMFNEPGDTCSKFKPKENTGE